MRPGLPVELTYGLERLAMYVLGKDNVYDMPFNDPDSAGALTYGDVFHRAEREYSRLQLRACRHGGPCCATSRMPRRPART